MEGRFRQSNIRVILKRMISVMLIALMVLTIWPAGAASAVDGSMGTEQSAASGAAEETVREIAKSVQESGQFYVGSSSAKIDEGGSYKLRIARGGKELPAASLRLAFIDITTDYGKDYKFRLLSDDIQESAWKYNKKASAANEDAAEKRASEDDEKGSEDRSSEDDGNTGGDSASILDEIREDPDGVTEVDGLDLGTLSEEELQEIYESDEKEMGEFVSRELQEYAEQDPDKYVFPTGNESKEADSGLLSKLYTDSTGSPDDNMPMSSDGKAALDINSLISGYTTDMLANAMDELHSANMMIDFAEGETERFIEITAPENDEAKGDLLFIAAVFSDSEAASVSEFSSFTGEIIDNEKWEKPEIGFAQDGFTAEDGYLTAELERKGTDTQFAAVKISTADGKARSGRDYSKVETVVFFPAGVNERTIRIPVRGDYLRESADFSMSLSDAANCRLGDISEATGWVGPQSGNYLLTGGASEEAETSAADVSLSMASAGEAEAYTAGDGDPAGSGTAAAGGGRPVPVGILKNERFDYRGESEGKVTDDHIHIMANDWGFEEAWCRFVSYQIREDKRSVYGYNGIRVDYEKSGGGNSQTGIALSDDMSDMLLYNKRNEEEKDRGFVDLYFDKVGRKNINNFYVLTTHNGSPITSRSNLDLYAVELIPRQFEYTASVRNAEDLKFVNENGDLVRFDQANLPGAGNFTISGQSDKGISTKYVGDTVTVNTDATYTYIKALYIGDTKITPDYPGGTSSVSFVMDEDFLRKYGAKAEYTKVSGKGFKGKFNIGVELGQYEAEFSLNNDDKRAELKLEGNYHKDADGNYVIHKGDYIRVRQSLRAAYSAAYKQSRIRFRTRMSSAGKISDDEKAFDENHPGMCIFPCVYASVDAYPIVEDNENRIVVRVRNKDIGRFKADEGIFNCRRDVSQPGYIDFIAVSKNDLNAGVRYSLSAVPEDDSNVAVWTPMFKSSRYSQNTFWFEADEKAENNVLILSCEKADDIPYSLSGRAYYSDVSLLTGVEGDAWMPADDVCVQITPIAYGLTDDEGAFSTMPMKGVEGCKVIYRTDSSRTDYRTITLTSGNRQSVNGTEVNSVDVGSFTVSSVNREAPYAAAASLQSGKSANGTIAYIGGMEEGIENSFNIFIYNDNCKYTDHNGEEKIEKVKDVELWAFDPLTNKAHGRINVDTEGKSSARRISKEGESTGIWQITADLREGEPNYQASDRLYIRIVTDRPKAEAYDAEGNVIEDNIFSSTAYPYINTGFVLSASDSAVPNTFDMEPVNTDLDLSEYIQLPIFNIMNCTCVIGQMAMSFQILPGNVHRFSIGKVLRDNTYGNDTDQDFDGLGDAVNKIREFGNTVHGTGKVGVKRGGAILPFAGMYLDFAVSELGLKSGGVSVDLEPLGGGIYFGCQGKFRLTTYFPVAVPFYIGMDCALDGYATAGFHNTDSIKYHAVKSGEADLNGSLDPDFTFKAEGWISAYAGVGLARVLGVRFGGTVYGQFIYNPTITDTFPTYRDWGFKLNIMIRMWLDAFFFQLPCPSYNLVQKPYGMFEDMAGEGRKGKQPAAGPSDDGLSSVMIKTVDKPSRWMPSRGLFRSSVSADGETVLQNGGYDQASPQLLDMGEDGLLLVFLQGDKSKGEKDRSTLSYSIYKDGTWSEPAPVGNEETLATGDFYPNVCDAGDSVMISWVSRRNEEYKDNLEYLSQMDVWSCMFDKSDHRVYEIENLTKEGDTAFMKHNADSNVAGLTNTCPVGVYDAASGDRMVYYQKSEVVKDPNVDSSLYAGYDDESAQLLANLSPTQNGNFLVYMLYDNDPKAEGGDGQESGGGQHLTKGWARNHIYSNEVESETDREYLIENFGGQRMLPAAVNDDEFTVNGRPAVIDFNAISYNGVGVYAYTIDKDNLLDTEYDRELFLQIYDFERHKTFHSIRITDDDVSDARPQLVRNVYNSNGDAHTWLFWLEGASVPASDGGNDISQQSGAAALRYLDIARLVSKGVNADGSIGKTENYPDNTYKITEELRTLSYQSDEYNGEPTFGSYSAFTDKNNDLYVTWLQQPSRDDVTGTEAEYSELVKDSIGTQEIYATALIDRDEGRSWSDGVRLTVSGRVNDSVAVAADENNELVTVGNQYRIDNSDDDLVQDLKLVATNYRNTGSLEAVAVSYSDDNPVPGDTVTASITVRNTGLKAAADGYEIKVYEMINGRKGGEPVYTASHTTSTGGAEVIPDDEAVLLPGASRLETFDWKIPDDFTGKKTMALYAEITEKGVDETDATCSAELGGLTVEEDYRISNVNVVQEEDGFRLDCDINNEGNASYGNGEVSVRAEFNDLYNEGGSELWVDEPIDSIGSGESVHFSSKFTVSDERLKHGFANGFVDIVDRDGESVTTGSDFIAALEHPGYIEVNGDSGLSMIVLAEGESQEISADYGPKDFYRDGTIGFSVDDGEIAHMEGNTLVPDKNGITGLRVFVTPYGGERSISVLVLSEDEKLAAEQVRELINSLPEARDITNDDYDRVIAARTAYDALTEAAAKMVDISRLRDAEAKLRSLSVDISAAAVTGITDRTFDGTPQTQNPVLTYNGKTLVKDIDYSVSYRDNTNAGKAVIVIEGLRNYKGSMTKTFVINKAANTMKVKGKTAKLSYRKLRKKSRRIARSKVIKVSGSIGKLTYTKAGGNKKIRINKKTGKVTVRKGLKRGSYKIKVKVKAKGDANYNALTRTVTFSVRVR